MRTTLNIDDELMKSAKIAAIKKGVTLTAYIEQLIRGAQKAERGTWKLTTHPGGPVVGRSFESTSALIDEVEGPLARP